MQNCRIKKKIKQTFYSMIILILQIDQEKKPGAILVFLPGWDEISQIEQMLIDDKNPYSLGDHANVIPLHSQININKQAGVFEPARKGIRKVILSTNIAETSVTIDDVVYVIDSGRINILR